jgi:hypothetical protein
MAVLLGSKNLSVIEEVVLTSSQTYTARRTGIADVICIGAGGQGGSSGKAAPSVNGNMCVNASGGGAGGYSRKRIPITAGDTFTVVVGAGGQANPSTKMPDADALKDGGAGGESTFDHASATANIALDSNGGAGGVGNQTTTASGATYAGGAGGTATGGDVNFTGGRGGTITRNNNTANNGMFATGGGAVAIFGAAFNGGDINFTGSNYKHSATGGAGIGGNGGDVAYDTGSGFSTSATSGGSASGAGNGFTSAQTAAVANGYGLTAAAKTDVVMGGGRLPSHGGNGFATNSMVYCIAGNGGTGALRAVLAGLGDSGYHSVYGGNEKPTEVIDSAAINAAGGWQDSTQAYYPQPTGPGGGGGGAAGDAYNNANNSVIAAGNGAAFAGGGGACSHVSNSELSNGNERISSSGRGGIGGGGSGGCILGTNASNSTNEWASGGDGVVIIQYLG